MRNRDFVWSVSASGTSRSPKIAQNNRYSPLNSRRPLLSIAVIRTSNVRRSGCGWPCLEHFETSGLPTEVLASASYRRLPCWYSSCSLTQARLRVDTGPAGPAFHQGSWSADGETLKRYVIEIEVAP